MQYSLQELAKYLDATLEGGEADINGLATLEQADAGQLTFFHSAKPRYLQQLKKCRAGAVLVSEVHKALVPTACLIVDDPYIAYARVSRLFSGADDMQVGGVAGSAVVAPTATLATDVILGPNVVVGANCKIGAGVSVGANTVLGNDCEIGAGSVIQPNVTFYSDVTVGENCRIHSGAVIGADGFGFAQDNGQWLKIYQLGGVRIGDCVEIGAGTTVDRGALDHTFIGNGVIIDNQVQIAHNVVIGDNTAIAGCTAIAGSTHIGEACTVAGACGITGHLEIAAGTHITAMSLVSKNIDSAGAYSSGTVAEPHSQWKRNVVRFRQLDEMSRKLKTLEAEFKQYKAKVDPNDGC
ncbi:UDP-3-O-(3-hydroxymyristoyl)glucosamine N-acyltransferase [Aliamphritea hakodatensis]|uniref:UDP-3-O-(3-hydroxymyristoyl)glucosamine N-acyltransferase n=1 Tax=Aliamphritea hakodatensis TaxID=2895352 RepID=UPI0022FD6AB4|nr:UDP-3-O-(3-hydroxymyristoyl)glucosamine N-acyltransferase [Aliamphritea hakodatensis]